MFFNNWIQFVNETYLFLGVCVALNTNYFYFDTYGNAINSLCSVLLGGVLLAFPIFIISFYTRESNYNLIK